MGLNTVPIPIDKRIRIKQMKNHHRSMARDVVCGGLKNSELARLYNMTESQVSVVVNSPCFIAEVARLEALADNAVMQVKRQSAIMSEKAIRVIEGVLDDADPENPDNEGGIDIETKKLGVKVAVDVLDRVLPKTGTQGSGAGDVYNTQINLDVRNMSKEELRDSVFDLLRE